jgi:branched-chain amino acid transport system permease protein
VIGLGAAVARGLGSIGGAIPGGLLFPALQTVGGVALPFANAARDGFALAVVTAIRPSCPTGRIAGPESGRA